MCNVESLSSYIVRFLNDSKGSMFRTGRIRHMVLR